MNEEGKGLREGATLVVVSTMMLDKKSREEMMEISTQPPLFLSLFPVSPGLVAPLRTCQ